MTATIKEEENRSKGLVISLVFHAALVLTMLLYTFDKKPEATDVPPIQIAWGGGGDNAALWVSGKRAGVYATGYVMDSPYIGRADDEWIEPADRGKELNFCPIQWTENSVDRPILKGDLLAAGGFEQARIIRQPWAGNPMKLTNAEWRVIERLG